MHKKLNNVKKSVETHTIQAHSINHHEEISEDFFPTLLEKYNINKDIRFDIISIIPLPNGDYNVEHQEDAFVPPMGR